MSIWTIQGETSKNFPATIIDVEEMGIKNGALTFTNQGNDSLSFLLLADDHATDPPNLPDRGQSITLYRSGIRQFFGYVTRQEYVWSPAQSGWLIAAENGWRELDRVPLTDADKEYLRAQGSLAATVTDIIDKAIAGGARIQRGSIATMFDITPIKFRGVNCGTALTEVLRIAADAVAYFDYTGTGFPTLNIVRRGSMTTKTLIIGTDEISEAQLSPIPDVTPSKITIAYATRDSNGIVTEAVQTAGSGTDAQSVILNESNFADFQAKVTAEQVAMQTTTTANGAFAIARDPKLKDIVDLPLPIATGSYTRPTGGTYTTKGLINVAGTSTSFSGLVAPNNNALLVGEMKDYMTSKLGITQGVCTFRGHLWWIYSLEDGTGGIAAPAWAAPLIAAGADILSGWWTGSESGPNSQTNPNTWSAHYLRLYVEFEAVCISRAFATLTNLRDPGNYGTLAPPASLASNLLAAQNWVPYRGRVIFTPWQAYERVISNKIDLTGTNPRLASMGATVQDERIDIHTGVRELNLGLPARSGGSSLARLKVLTS